MDDYYLSAFHGANDFAVATPVLFIFAPAPAFITLITNVVGEEGFTPQKEAPSSAGLSGFPFVRDQQRRIEPRSGPEGELFNY